MGAETKRCSRGDECLTPGGPELPRTSEYFYVRDNGWASAMCRRCHKVWRSQHHAKNREHDNARSKAYYRENGDKYANYTSRYYARKLANGGKFTHDELDTLYKQQKGCCWWCGAFVGLTFDTDHRVPVSQGGSSDISNIVISCRECNRSKRDKLPHEWEGGQERLL